MNEYIGDYVRSNWETLFHEKYHRLDAESPFE